MSAHTRNGIIIAAILVLGVGFLLWRANFFKIQTAETSTTALYSCSEGKTIEATFFSGESTPAASDQPPTPGGRAEITLSDGRHFSLKQAVSANGTKYVNEDESFVFWPSGNDLLVLENNKVAAYAGCMRVAANPGTLPAVYANAMKGISLRFPALATTSVHAEGSYTVNESFSYDALGPQKSIAGTSFTIPAKTAEGTNLASDSYISVEQIPQAQTCSADLFLSSVGTPTTVTEGDTTYSLATTTGAGAGNRYEETVYAIPGTNPCTAVRYFVHYGVLENYPDGSVTPFDHDALIREFDSIRRTLVINR